MAVGGARAGRVINRKLGRYIETDHATRRAARRMLGRYGKTMVLALRENRNWKRGHPRNRKRYPVPSGQRFGYRVKRSGYKGLDLLIDNDAPYPIFVERRFRRIAATDRRLRSARRRKEPTLVARDVQAWLDRNTR